jgi:hypothetical protein
VPDVPFLLWLLTTPQVICSVLFWVTAAAVSYRPLVRRFALPPRPAALALASFTAVAIVTLTPAATTWGLEVGPHGCLSIGRTELVEAFTHFGRGIQEKVNILMLVPFGFFLTLATRRPWWSGAACAALPAVIEGLQGAFLGRVCSPLDWTDNAAGGVAGVAIAMVALRLSQRRMQHADTPT